MKLFDNVKKLFLNEKEDDLKCVCCGNRYHNFSLAYMVPHCDVNIVRNDDIRTEDLCTIKDQNSYFIRAILEVPIIGHDTYFTWGVWVSQSEQNFNYYKDNFSDDLSGRVTFGWLSNNLYDYVNTFGLKTDVHFSKKGLRPKIIIQECEHQLYLDQINGITIERAEQILNNYNESIKYERN